MGRTMHATGRLVAGAIAVGTITLGTAGAASATAPTASSLAPTANAPAPLLAAGSGRLAHFDCGRAAHVLARIQRGEAGISVGLPKLTAAEARARAAGDTVRADRIQRRITRLESPKFKGRLDRLAAGIEAKCHAPAPQATPATPTSTPGT